MAHGVDISEVPTGVRPPVRTTAGTPVYIGAAKVNAGDLTFVNVPGIFFTLGEYETKCGPVAGDLNQWTLDQAAKAHFELYEVAPFIAINVLDPENPDHIASVTGEVHLLDSDGQVALQTYGAPDEAVLGILKATVVIKKASVTKTVDVDYSLAFDDDGALIVTALEGGTLAAGDTITADFDYLDPTALTADDIIGGYSTVDGTYSGLEVVKQIYPALQVVPGLLLSPKWSQVPEVAARLGVLARNLDAFRCMAVVDLPTDPAEIATYAAAPAYKTDNGFDAIDMITCWPKVKQGDDVYHMSVHVACVANVTDAEHDGIPYVSPSNKDLNATSAVDDDGNEILLTREQANFLNDRGIVTARSGFAGWKVWGNRTAGYPGTTDPKDAFIPIRRMFSWIGNTVILTTDRDVDDAGNRRLIDSVLGTVGAYLNSLVAAGALIKGVIEFRPDENPTTDLADGKIKWHLTLTPPSPAEQLEFVLEYDPAALEALFEA